MGHLPLDRSGIRPGFMQSLRGPAYGDPWRSHCSAPEAQGSGVALVLAPGPLHRRPAPRDRQPPSGIPTDHGRRFAGRRNSTRWNPGHARQRARTACRRAGTRLGSSDTGVSRASSLFNQSKPFLYRPRIGSEGTATFSATRGSPGRRRGVRTRQSVRTPKAEGSPRRR